MGNSKNWIMLSMALLCCWQPLAICEEAGAISILPNLTSVSFDEKSDKISATTKGLYCGYTVEKDTFAISVAKTSLETNVDSFESVEQTDFSLGINGIDEDGWNVGMTTHLISSPDNYIWSSFSINGNVGKYYGYDSYYGMQLSYSSYTPPKNNIFQVYQAGYVQDWYYKNFTLSLNPKIIYASGMGADDDILNKISGSYLSVTVTPTFHFSVFSIGASATFGEERFAVQNNGFVVNNSPDLYTSQNSAFAGVKISDLYIKGITGKSVSRTFGSDDESESNFTSFSINFSF